MNTPYTELEKELFLERPELHFQPTYSPSLQRPPPPSSQPPFIYSIPPTQNNTIIISQNAPAPASSPSVQTAMKNLASNPFTVTTSPMQQSALPLQQGQVDFRAYYPMMMQAYGLTPHPTMMTTGLDAPVTMPSVPGNPLGASVPPMPMASPSPQQPMMPGMDLSNIATTTPHAISPSIPPFLPPAAMANASSILPTQPIAPVTTTTGRLSPASPSSYLSDDSPVPTPLTATNSFTDLAQLSPKPNQQQQNNQNQHKHSPLVNTTTPASSTALVHSPHSPNQHSPNTPPSSTSSAVAKLEQEVDDLKHELWLARQKQSSSFPFLGPVQPKNLAMSLWKLPEGELVDFSAGFHAMLAFVRPFPPPYSKY